MYSNVYSKAIGHMIVMYYLIGMVIVYPVYSDPEPWQDYPLCTLECYFIFTFLLQGKKLEILAKVDQFTL